LALRTEEEKEERSNLMHVRWMIKRDMPEVLAIETHCFTEPWTECDFANCLRSRSVIGMVAELDERPEGDSIVGYMIYDMRKNDLHLLNIAVHPGLRRQIIGASMVQKLFAKLSRERRRRITAEVRESNYAAQLFFKSLGFFCTEVIRDCYDDSEESGYRFQYDLCPPVRLLLANRVSKIQQAEQQ
jgi:[ribosomal protein S18]-alanine N-acetyltransferase